MTKALTVSALNAMFSNHVDQFEFAQERDDWKFPKYVKYRKRVDDPQLDYLETLADDDDG